MRDSLCSVEASPPRRAPDLLFEDEQRARVAELAHLLDAPEELREVDPLHRITVFLTYRCNLACPYCKTIARSEEELERWPQKRVEHSLASFRAMLEAHRGTAIRHVHFTGGEAGIVRGLVEMVRTARELGAEAISLTSNGTLPAALYLELVEGGLTELRISLDADEAALGERLTQRRAAFGATVRTLTDLAEARAQGIRFALILNTVVGLENRERLGEIVRFLLRFAPDDIKLITNVDLRGTLDDFPGAQRSLEEVEEQLRRLPEDAMPLLRRKLRTVFARDAIGLESTETPDSGKWRCYIPLTERTVDAVSYYPCSVYLREGGPPLGALSDSPEVQRERSLRFVRDRDCRTDPICRRFCLNCTRAFNERANEARR